MSHDTPFLSIIVPCYNEEAVLPEIYARLTAVCAPYAAQGYEIIFVNDGSSDSTWPQIVALSMQDKHVHGLCLSRNFGHSMALTAGIDACRGQRVMIIDADLQDPPELLPQMMTALDAGANVAYGQRLRRGGETWFKLFSARLFYRLLNRISDVDVPVDTGDFRLVDRKIVEALRAMPETARYTRGMVAWAGFNQVPIQYERQKRFAGKTHYTLEKMLRLALDAITGFSNQPLRIAFYVGIFMIFLSLLILIYIVHAYISGDTVAGWASLAFLLVGLQGVQWFFLGLMGEYIARIYQESKNRPKYLISAEV